MPIDQLKKIQVNRNGLHFTATTMAKSKKYESLKFPIIFKLICGLNFLTGTIPVFYKRGEKFAIISKNFRLLYIAFLFVVSAVCLTHSKETVSKFAKYKKGFTLRFILHMTGLISTVLSTCMCWITSMMLSKCHAKIINDNTKFGKLLSANREKRNIPLLIGTVYLPVIFAVTNMILSIYFTLKNYKNSDFNDLWFHILITIKDWFVIAYLSQQNLNLHYLKIVNNELKAFEINQLSSLKIDTIMIILRKLQENNVSAKYIISFPVMFYS